MIWTKKGIVKDIVIVIEFYTHNTGCIYLKEKKDKKGLIRWDNQKIIFIPGDTVEFDLDNNREVGWCGE